MANSMVDGWSIVLLMRSRTNSKSQLSFMHRTQNTSRSSTEAEKQQNRTSSATISQIGSDLDLDLSVLDTPSCRGH